MTLVRATYRSQALLAVAICLTLAGGCKPEIQHEYGQRDGFQPGSVNGTAVFAEMFENAGHSVYSWRVLSPRLEKRADCIVWFPDDFEPPTAEVRIWLENWLQQQPARTLIYVGRDFDAEPGYWQRILPLAPADQRAEVRQRLTDAQARVTSWRSLALSPTSPGPTSPAMKPPTTKPPPTKPPTTKPPTTKPPGTKSPSTNPPTIQPPTLNPSSGPWPPSPSPIIKSPVKPSADSKPWFRVDTSPPQRQAQPLSGVYADEIDGAKTEIELATRLVPSPRWATFLASGKDRLVSRRRFGSSRLVVVVNGSFLLNLPLLNHEHRKLAAKLIAEVGAPGKNVVFLESGAGGPAIRSKDPDPHEATGIEILAVWPTNWILLQAIAVGILACFWRWPIFGVPRPGPAVAPGDFGRHITALAELLRRSRDQTFAQARLLQFRQKTEAVRADGKNASTDQKNGSKPRRHGEHGGK